MKISILGAGNVGGTLGKCWANKGHDILFGVRNPKNEKTQILLKEIGKNVKAGIVGDAISFSDRANAS